MSKEVKKYETNDQLVELPQTREAFELWAKQIFTVGGIEDTPDHRQVLAQTIQRLDPDQIAWPLRHFITALKKSDANMVAYLVILECRHAEQLFEQEQEAKLKAREVNETHVAPV